MDYIHIENFLNTLDTRSILRYIKFHYKFKELDTDEYISVISFVPKPIYVSVRFRYYTETGDESEVEQIEDEDLYDDMNVKYEDMLKYTDIVQAIRKNKIKNFNKDNCK
jgi:hypothetical protein